MVNIRNELALSQLKEKLAPIDDSDLFCDRIVLNDIPGAKVSFTVKVLRTV